MARCWCSSSATTAWRAASLPAWPTTTATSGRGSSTSSTPRRSPASPAPGLRTPADLRAALYADVHAHYGGFAFGQARLAALDRLAERLELPCATVESLLIVDAEDRAPLVRLAPPPEPAEVSAIYNHLVVSAVLRAAARVELGAGRGCRRLRRRAARARRRSAWPSSPRPTRRLALLGACDALGSWTRQGRRLVRALLATLARFPGAVRNGWARVEARGTTNLCRLTADYWQSLAGPRTELPRDAATWPAANPAGWDPRPELLALRRQGAVNGWTLRGWPAPLVYPEGVLLPEFALQRAGRTVAVVPVDGPALLATVERLAPRLAARDDVLLVGHEPAAPTLADLALPWVDWEAEAPLATVLQAVDALPRRDRAPRRGPGAAARRGPRGGLPAAGPSRFRLQLEPQRVAWPRSHPVVHVGAKLEDLPAIAA